MTFLKVCIGFLALLRLVPTLTFAQCGFSGGNLRVASGNTCTISSNISISGDIILEDNASFTVGDDIILDVGEDAQIIIEPGSVLTVDDELNVGDGMFVQINCLTLVPCPGLVIIV